MINIDYSGKRAVIVGYGVTGRALYDFLNKRGASVEIFDDSVAPDLSHIVFSTSDKRFRDSLAIAQLVVVSPGVPPNHPVFGGPITPISELEFAARHTNVELIAVTGTNGKTTVVTLVAEMLAKAGKRTVAVGNIGEPMISHLDEEIDQFVVEASSFQLATTSEFHPHIALWTNFSSDHLDWHGGIDHYLSSKAKIFANQTPGDVAVINAKDVDTVGKFIAPGVKIITFGADGSDFGISGDQRFLTHNDQAFVEIKKLPRALPHDLENALAGAAAAYIAGVSLEQISDVLRRFEGLAHRVEFVRTIDSVAYFNDSKATTPASVLAAVGGFDAVVLIAGGKNKGLDLSPLLGVATRLKALVVIGEAGDDLLSLFKDCAFAKVKATSMRDAVRKAAELAEAGSVVLLSPGCASFDWYSSYSERGDDFKSVVGQMSEERGSE